MIRPDDLFDLAATALADGDDPPHEAVLRRAVSAIYYGLFHLLTGAGAHLFASGGHLLQRQVARGYNHSTMAKVCEAYRILGVRRPTSIIQHIVPGSCDPRLRLIADAFVELQTGRHTADYDVSHVFEPDTAYTLIRLALTARDEFAAIRHLPETTTFLTALLLADRWTRRG